MQLLFFLENSTTSLFVWRGGDSDNLPKLKGEEGYVCPLLAFYSVSVFRSNHLDNTLPRKKIYPFKVVITDFHVVPRVLGYH